MEVLINHTVTAELQNMLPPPWNKLDKYGIRAAELEVKELLQQRVTCEDGVKTFLNKLIALDCQYGFHAW